MMKIKLPKGQILWERLCDKNSITRQIVTSDALRQKYYLYQVNDDNSLIKLETNTQPVFKNKRTNYDD